MTEQLVLDDLDLDLERGDRELERLLEAVMAAAARPRPCRCPRPLLLDDDEERHCCRCGREVAG
jgi:hypothetical protein